MVGAVRGVDPETGYYYDDTKRYVDALPSLSAADRAKILELNARKVYPRINRTPGLGTRDPGLATRESGPGTRGAS
jgi:hypothetical protein